MLYLLLLLYSLGYCQEEAEETIFLKAAHRNFNLRGNPFFIVGVNYQGWFDRCWSMWSSDFFNKSLVERDFRKAKRAGFNTMRIFIQEGLVKDILKNDFSKLDYVVSIAKKYKIYLILTLWDYLERDLEKVIKINRTIAERYDTEDIIIAYDLKNEPSILDITSSIYPSDSIPIVQTEIFTKLCGEDDIETAACQIISYPKEVKAGDVFSVKVEHYVSKSLRKVKLNCEIRDKEKFKVIDKRSNEVIGEGSVLFTFQAPASDKYSQIIVVAWTGEEWQSKYDWDSSEKIFVKKGKINPKLVSPKRLTIKAKYNSLVAKRMYEKYISEMELTFPYLKGLKTKKLPINPKWEHFVKFLNQTIENWLKVLTNSIRQVDRNHLITIGYDSPLFLFPSNAGLDFISLHVFIQPDSYESVLRSLNVGEKAAMVWDDKPIVYGEFGYSNGPYNEDLTALCETLHYIFLWHGGYGGCIKWMLNDNPTKFRGDTNTYEAGFGVYSYDGGDGVLKPVGATMNFFSEYIKDASEPYGDLNIFRPSDKQSGPVNYLYLSNNAFFVGTNGYVSPILKFFEKKTTQLLISYKYSAIKILSTNDITLHIDFSKLVANWSDKDTIIYTSDGSKVHFSLTTDPMHPVSLRVPKNKVIYVDVAEKPFKNWEDVFPEKKMFKEWKDVFPERERPREPLKIK